MRKLKLLFALSLLTFVAGNNKLFAQAMPLLSDETHVYEYYLQNTGINNTYYVTSVVGTGDVLSFNDSGDYLKVKFVPSTISGEVSIVPTNVEGKTVIGVSNGNAGTAVVYYADVDAAMLASAIVSWKLTSATLCPTGTQNSWNMYGGISQSVIKLYNKGDQGSRWRFIPANEAALAAIAPGYETPLTGTKTVAEFNEWYNGLTTAPAAGAIALTTGYYRLRNADRETFNSYVYNEGTNTRAQVPDISLLSRNNFMWRLTHETGSTAVSFRNGGGNGIWNRTKLTLGVSNFWQEGIVYFTEGLHFSNQAHYTLNKRVNGSPLDTQNNPFTPTGWEYATSRGSSYYLEPVDISEYEVYNVNIVGGNGNYLTRTVTGEIAVNGGFFLMEKGTVPTAADFEASAMEGGTAVLTVTPAANGEEGVIRVTYGPALVEGAIYSLRNKKSNNYVYHNPEFLTGSNNILGAKTTLEYRSFFKVTGNPVDGYTLRPAYSHTHYVYSINTDNANDNVGVKETEEPFGDDCKWLFVKQGDGWNILPKGSPNGWNMRGRGIGLWDNNASTDNTWYIQSATEYAAENSAYPSTVVGSLTGKMTEALGAATILAENTTEENFNALKAILNETHVVVPQNGWYRIKNKGLNMYLFSESADNPKHITFLNDGNANSKYYWYVTFEGTNATLTATTGLSMAKASGQDGYTMARTEYVSPVALQAASNATRRWTENYFLFPNIHATAQDVYTKNTGTPYDAATNPYILTTWTTTNETNQYSFEPVNFAEGEQVYTLEIDGLPDGQTPTVTYTNATYTGNATVYEKGVFVLSSVPSMEDIQASTMGYYSASEKVLEGTTIKVRYSIDKDLYADSLLAVTQKAQAILSLRGVGYPTTESETYRALQQAIGEATVAVSDSEELGFTEIGNLEAAINAYKSSAEGVQMPENGQAFVLLNVLDVNQKALKHTSNSWGCEYQDCDVSVPENIDLAFVYICHKMSDGQFVFVNSAGKYLALKGTAGNVTTANDNKGYTNAYDTTYSHHTLVHGHRFGCLSIKGHESGREVFFTRSNLEDVFNQGAGKVDPSDATHSTDFRFVEYTPSYNKNVILTQLNADEFYVATYSAPFPAVIPAEVSVYAITGSANGSVATRFMGTGPAILPAGTGVILASNHAIETQYLPPVTTEIYPVLTVPEDNKLVGTGSATSDELVGVHILANGEEGIAFYPIKGGTKVPAYRAYLDLTSSSADVKALLLDFGHSEVTGIEEMKAETSVARTSSVYDLSGRVVRAPQRGGLYIKDGRKFIRR